MTSEGVILSDKKIPTPEEVMENWGEMTSLDNPSSLTS
jgi:hypothetical protein